MDEDEFDDWEDRLRDAEEEFESYKQDDDEVMFFSGQREEEEEAEVILPSLPPAPPPRLPQLVEPNIKPSFHLYFESRPSLGKRQMNMTLLNGDTRFYSLLAPAEKPEVVVSLPTCTLSRIIPLDVFQRIESQVELEILRAGNNSNEKEDLVIAEKQKENDTPLLTSSSIPLVSRFRPQRFVDLLSHERKNREALKWLKSWESPPVSKRPGERAAEDATTPEGRKYRPKILLLTGPAGTGKTTLAHIIAKHAGYRVVEINASDDRTAQSLKHHLENVTESQSEVFSTLNQKSLLLLDEVDGILDGVPMLVQYAQDKHKTRPIICTCNDVFVPALRALRQVSLVLTVNLPNRSRLVKRLQEICHSIQVKPSPGALESICDRMDDDIRATLNALDFWLHSSDPQNATLLLTMASVKSLPAFSKDSTQDLFQLWHELLISNRASLVSFSNSGGGDMELLVDGVFENFLRGRYLDPTLQRTWQASEWFSFVDVMQAKVHVTMDFFFNAYLPCALLGLGKLVACKQHKKLMFPTAAATHRQIRFRNQETTKEMTGVHKETLLFLPHLVFPFTVRNGVPFHALTELEREEVQRIALLNQEYNLSWKCGEDGSEWVMDPPVYHLVHYGQDRVLTLSSSDLARTLIKQQPRKRKVGPANVDAPEVVSSKKSLLHVPEAAVVTKTATVRKDFFGRVLAVQEPRVKTGEAPKRKKDFVYRFNEGFTDAVRRSVKMKNLV